jgi:hypothetical protein
MESFHFVLPVVAICGTLLWIQHKHEHGSVPARIRRLFGLLVPFALGVAIPIAVFLIPYLFTKSIGDVYNGVFVMPQRRFQYGLFDFPPFVTVVASVPYALLLLCGFSPSRRPLLDAIIIIAVLVFALGASSNFYVYQVIWQSARSLAVVAVLAGCLLIARSFRSVSIPSKKHQMLLLLLIMTALVSFVQFPFPAPIYFCYIAPLVALTLLAVVSMQDNAPRPFHLGILTFYFLFALLWTNTGYVLDRDPDLVYRIGLGQLYSEYRPQNILDVDRGGIRVLDAERDLYAQVVSLARTHRGGSDYIYAAPDCPEVYFLSGLRNPTRNVVDFLNDKEDGPSDILALLEEKAVDLVVINRYPGHSPRLDRNVVAILQEHYPQSLEVGIFTVRWRK